MLLRRILRNKLAVFSLVIMGVYLAALIAPGWIAPLDPRMQDTGNRLAPPMTERNGRMHYLGTDHLGRDTLSRIIHGTRLSMFISLVAVTLSMLIGVGLGTVSGYVGGMTDVVLMRVVDTVLAFPMIVLLIALAAIVGPSLTNVIGLLTFAGFSQYARLTRASVKALKNQEFIEGARALGASNFRIVLRHVWPNITAPIIVYLTFQFTRVLITESTLSFLGVGVQPPSITWGMMIGDARTYILTAPWASALPGVAMVIAVLCCNLIGDAMRDVLDPTLKT